MGIDWTTMPDAAQFMSVSDRNRLEKLSESSSAMIRSRLEELKSWHQKKLARSLTLLGILLTSLTLILLALEFGAHRAFAWVGGIGFFLVGCLQLYAGGRFPEARHHQLEVSILERLLEESE